MLGRRPGFIAQLCFIYVAETEREAYEQTRRTFTRYARYDCGVDWDGRTDMAAYAALSARLHFLIGTPEQVAERPTAWQSGYGFDEIICQRYAAGMRHEASSRAIELLGRAVLPRLRSGESAGVRER